MICAFDLVYDDIAPAMGVIWCKLSYTLCYAMFQKETIPKTERRQQENKAVKGCQFGIFCLLFSKIYHNIAFE